MFSLDFINRYFLEELRQDKGIVRGSVQAEEQHAQRSQHIGTLAKHFAEAIGMNTYEGKHYRIQSESDSLKIFVKDGREEVFNPVCASIATGLRITLCVAGVKFCYA